MNTIDRDGTTQSTEIASTMTMRERLEAAAAKIDELADQFDDDGDLRWELKKIADRTRGKVINPATAKITWMYEDPFGSLGDIVYLARAPESDVWIDFYDLPEATSKALLKRINAGEIEDDQPERERWPFWARTVRDQLEG